MRRFLLLSLVACGCDWDAAERQARCNAGDPTACDGGTGSDGGGGDGGGTQVDPTLGPIGLFPRGDAGALSLASNTAAGGLVTWFDAQGARVAGGRSFGGRIISAYADGVSTQMFAAIVQGDGGSRLELLFEDGGSNSAPTTGNHVTVYFTDTGVFASVWSTASARYGQEIYEASFIPQPPLPPENCDVTFHDLEVLRVGEGTRVVIPWSAASCSGVGVAVGISAGTGIQSITSMGLRSAIASTGPTRVGRFSDTNGAGFDVCGPAGAQAAFLERFDFNRTTELFSSRPGGTIETVGTLQLGDVSGGVVVGQATGQVTIRGRSTDAGGFAAGTHTVFAAAPFAGWVRALGRGVPGSNVEVLRQGNTVFVAYLVDDGGTSLVRLDALSGDEL